MGCEINHFGRNRIRSVAFQLDYHYSTQIRIIIWTETGNCYQLFPAFNSLFTELYLTIFEFPFEFLPLSFYFIALNKEQIPHNFILVQILWYKHMTFTLFPVFTNQLYVIISTKLRKVVWLKGCKLNLLITFKYLKLIQLQLI